MNRAFVALRCSLLRLLRLIGLLRLRRVLRLRNGLLLLPRQVLLLPGKSHFRLVLGWFKARNRRLLRDFSNDRVGDTDAITVQSAGQNLRECGSVDGILRRR